MADSLRNTGFQHAASNAPDVHSGIFHGPVRVLGQDGRLGCSFLILISMARIRYHSDIALPTCTRKRVLTVAPMPPEKLAYALARYSRSPDSIKDSVEWVRTHDSAKFLESFYFQYGHASIADLGHVTVCFEGVSETGRNRN